MNRFRTKLVLLVQEPWLRCFGVVLAMGLIVSLTTPAAQADLLLKDLNSEVLIDGASQAGMHEWKVNGRSYLGQQWFWYRIGDAGPEASVDTLIPVSQMTFDLTSDGIDDAATLKYQHPLGLTVQLMYTLMGGEPGSGVSDIGEQIRITNPRSNTESFDLHFFQFADFNISPNDDTVLYLSQSQVVQIAPGLMLSETVVTDFPQHHEAGEATILPTTLTKLNDGVATTLNDADGPITGDATWAFQWDFTLAPGDSFVISKDKSLEVPEPATLALLIAAAAALAVYGWQRKR
jgi:hypothetical protein